MSVVLPGDDGLFNLSSQQLQSEGVERVGHLVANYPWIRL